MLCASIILPMTPPVLLAVVSSTTACVSERPDKIPFRTSPCAVIFCNEPNRALDDVSEPVRATPSQPRNVAKNG